MEVPFSVFIAYSYLWRTTPCQWRPQIKGSKGRSLYTSLKVLELLSRLFPKISYVIIWLIIPFPFSRLSPIFAWLDPFWRRTYWKGHLKERIPKKDWMRVRKVNYKGWEWRTDRRTRGGTSSWIVFNKKGHNFRCTQKVNCTNKWIPISDLESILPNFFLRKTKIFFHFCN